MVCVTLPRVCDFDVSARVVFVCQCSPFLAALQLVVAGRCEAGAATGSPCLEGQPLPRTAIAAPVSHPTRRLALALMELIIT